MSFTKSTLGWFDQLSIQAKFRLIFGILGGLTAIALMVVLVGVMRIDSSNRSYVQVVEASGNVAEARTLLGNAEISVERAIRTGEATGINEARVDLAGAREATQRAADGLRDVAPDIAGSAEGLRDAVVSYDNALATLAPQLGDGSARQAAIDAALERQVTVENGVVDVMQAEDAAAERFRQDGEDHTSMLIVALAVVGLVALVTIFGAFSMVRNAIIRPLDRITAATRSLVAGESDVTIPCTSRAHEVGELARALKVFKDNMIEMERLQAAAAEDATTKLREQEEREASRDEALKQRTALLNDLVDRFERTVGDVVHGVAAASGELQATASSMAATAEQSAQQAGEVSTALTEASSGVTAAAAASDEFAMSIGEISRQASTSADLARTAATNAADADKTISALTTAANQIGQIVELISSIAQRTNLLALNASIEAARGGEAGRGFAVVASEVKDLAAQTSKATDEVAEQIRTIQESTAASVQALRTIGEHVGQLESTSISIAAAVDQQSVAGQDLARSIDLAARNTDDVSTNIGQVREGTVATGAAASQVLSSSSELQLQAGSLKAKAEEFLAQIRAA